MRLCIVLMLSGVLLCATAQAGTIFGTIKKPDGKPIDEGKKIKAVMGETAVDSDKTNKSGFYRLSCKENGKVKLRFTYDENPLSFNAYSYSNPVRYDLRIVRKDDGSYGLIRD